MLCCCLCWICWPCQENFEYFLCCATLTSLQDLESPTMLLSMIVLHFPDSVVTSHKYLLGQKLRSSFQQTLQLYFLSHINIQISCHPSLHLFFQGLGTTSFFFFSLLALFNAVILVGILARLVKKSTCEQWMPLSGWDCESQDHIPFNPTSC